MAMQLTPTKKKYAVVSIILGCFLLFISYTDIAILPSLAHRDLTSNYSIVIWWLSLSLLTFGVGVIFTQKKIAFMLALATPIVISIIAIVTQIPLYPHFYDYYG